MDLRALKFFALGAGLAHVADSLDAPRWVNVADAAIALSIAAVLWAWPRVRARL